MSIQFGRPVPPHLFNPLLFFEGAMIGLGVLLFVTFLTDRLGTAMFHRGFAKPFYLKGRRIHHSCIYVIVPGAYGIIMGLFLMGYIQLIWNSLWTNLATVCVIVAIAIALDFIGDRFWPKIRRDVILHHEWIYTIIPAYIFTYVLNVII